jgi:hypothetical protein
MVCVPLGITAVEAPEFPLVPKEFVAVDVNV